MIPDEEMIYLIRLFRYLLLLFVKILRNSLETKKIIINKSYNQKKHILNIQKYLSNQWNKLPTRLQ